MQVKKVLTDKNAREKTKRLYLKAFPKEERVPWALLCAMAIRDNTDFLAFYEDGIYRGFCFLYHFEDLTLVHFLAVENGQRGNGYGSKFLEHIKRTSTKKTVVLVIETVSDKYDNFAQRQKRRHFYFKNGFADSGLRTFEFSVWFDVLYYGEPVGEQQYRRLINKLFLGFCRPKIKKA